MRYKFGRPISSNRLLEFVTKMYSNIQKVAPNSEAPLRSSSFTYATTCQNPTTLRSIEYGNSDQWLYFFFSSFFFFFFFFFFFGMVPWQISSCSERRLKKKTGMLSKERKEKRRKKELSWLVFFRGFQNGLVLYSLVLQPNENAESRNRKYALKNLSALTFRHRVSSI